MRLFIQDLSVYHPERRSRIFELLQTHVGENHSCYENVSGKPITGLTAHIFRYNYCTMLCYQIPKISLKRISQLLGDKEKMALDVMVTWYGKGKDAPGAVNDAITF